MCKALSTAYVPHIKCSTNVCCYYYRYRFRSLPLNGPVTFGESFALLVGVEPKAFPLTLALVQF